MTRRCGACCTVVIGENTQLFWFCNVDMITPFNALEFWCLWRWFRRSLSLVYEDEDGGCNSKLPNFAAGNPLAFAVKYHSFAVLSVLVFISCGTRCLNHQGPRAHLGNGSMHSAD